MFTSIKTKFAASIAMLSLALVAPAAFASGGGIDVSAVVTAIQAAAAPIAAIGAAVLIILVGVKVYKWVRRAL